MGWARRNGSWLFSPIKTRLFEDNLGRHKRKFSQTWLVGLVYENQPQIVSSFDNGWKFQGPWLWQLQHQRNLSLFFKKWLKISSHLLEMLSIHNSCPPSNRLHLSFWWRSCSHRSENDQITHWFLSSKAFLHVSRMDLSPFLTYSNIMSVYNLPSDSMMLESHLTLPMETASSKEGNHKTVQSEKVLTVLCT